MFLLNYTPRNRIRATWVVQSIVVCNMNMASDYCIYIYIRIDQWISIDLSNSNRYDTPIGFHLLLPSHCCCGKAWNWGNGALFANAVGVSCRAWAVSWCQLMSAVRWEHLSWFEMIWLVVFRHPSAKYDFVSWDYEIPNIWKNKKCSKPPTSVRTT